MILLRKKIQFIIFLVYTSFISITAQTNRNYISHTFTNNTLIVKCDSGTLWVQPFAENIIKVTLLNPGEIHPDTSNSVVLRPQELQVKFEDEAGFLELSTSQVSVRINKAPLKFEFIRGKELLAVNNSFFVGKDDRGFKFSLKPDESIYGTGFRSIPIDRRGYKLKLYNEPVYGYGLNTENLNYCIPLAISSQCYMILFDNPEKGFMDIGKSNKDEMIFDAIGGELTYYFIADNSFDALEQSYTMLTGTQPMPPRWVLGNLQSRMSYSSEAETRDIVDKMIEEKFPLDAVIIDLNWFGKFDGAKPNTCLMGNLSWDNDNWKNPRQMIKDFSDKGIKTILVAEPFVIKESFNFDYIYKNNLAGTDSAGNPYVIKEFYFGNGLLLDIFKPATRDWFWKQYKTQIDNGVAGWWGDLGEPEKHPSGLRHVNGKADEVHNIYGHYWDKMLFDGYKKEYPDFRLFNLNRSGFAGSQRYSVYPWTGDVSRSWGGYQAQLPILLSMSMCGLAYIHSDLGGFTPGAKDEELYTRWLQLGLFSPVFRVHGDSKLPPEPIFYSDTTKKVIRDLITLRYKILPYNYTLAWQNSTKGSPLMRPLYYYEPDKLQLRNYSDEFYWGESFLVAPVLVKGQTEKEVYLPEGIWFNFWNDTRHEGGNTINEKLTIAKFPVYVKAGSFIPMVGPVNNTTAYSSASISLHYYFDAAVKSSSYMMYEDDGKTNGAYEKGLYELLSFTATNNSGQTIIHLDRSGGSYEGMPVERNIEFVIHNVQSMPVSVVFNGKNIVPLWDKELKQLRFNVKWEMNPVTIEIN